MATTAASVWRRAQEGWPKSFPVAQAPNPPLIVAIAGLVVAVLTDDPVRPYAQGVFYAALAAWAYEELADGANWFRRALGAAGLAFVAIRVGAALKS